MKYQNKSEGEAARAERVLAAKRARKAARIEHKAKTAEDRRLAAKERGIARATRWSLMFKGDAVCTECGASGMPDKHLKVGCAGIFIKARVEGDAVHVEPAADGGKVTEAAT